jgi:hypothetical protein
MSLMGHSRHLPAAGMSASHPKATTERTFRDVGFVPTVTKAAPTQMASLFDHLVGAEQHS